MSDDCPLCATVRAGGPGGSWVMATDEWGVMGHLLQVPGWLTVLSLQHRESLAELTPGETAQLGPLLRYLATALKESTGVERVYTYSLGHSVRHLHILIGVPGNSPEAQGPRLLTRILQREESVTDAAASQHALASVRRWIVAHPIDLSTA